MHLFGFLKQCYVVKTTKVTLSALKSSPKQVVEQEIPHVRNKDRGINTEYVSMRQDRPNPYNRTPDPRTVVTSSTTCTYIYLNYWVFGTRSTTLGRFIIHKNKRSL